jgi:hypothetical protein
MKMKLVFTAMLAILLAFGMTFVSCDDGSGDKDPPKIPTKLVGTWDSALGFHCFVINSNGTGTVYYSNDPEFPCMYEHSIIGGVEKLKLIIPNGPECTYDCTLVGDQLTLSAPNPADSPLIIYASTFSPYTKYVPPIGGGDEEFISTIPAKYTGTWDSIPGLGSGSIQGVFVINGDGTGKGLVLSVVYDCAFMYSDANGVEKLKWITPEHGECIYDCAITGGNLVLSNPVPDSAGATAGLAVYASMLSPYSKAQ